MAMNTLLKCLIGPVMRGLDFESMYRTGQSGKLRWKANVAYTQNTILGCANLKFWDKIEKYFIFPRKSEPGSGQLGGLTKFC